jgi:3-hydroxyacyl-CoA dehydrogenase
MKASATILASNTSSIMLEQLDDGPDPGKLVGLHFFNPVAQTAARRNRARRDQQ